MSRYSRQLETWHLSLSQVWHCAHSVQRGSEKLFNFSNPIHYAAVHELPHVCGKEVSAQMEIDLVTKYRHSSLVMLSFPTWRIISCLEVHL